MINKALGITSLIVLMLSVHFMLAAQSPNVIIILTDDQGYGDFSINGNPLIKTPNIDQLGGEGIRFTDFHVSSMCTPTRGQLMTGMDAMRNGAINVSSGRALMDPALNTMADVFKEAGYSTGIFGKWHLGDNYPFRPEDRGFDEAIWFPSSHLNSVADYWDNDYFDDFYNHKGRREKFNGYCTDVFFNEAISWMEKKNENAEPFFTFLSLNAAHWPPYVPEKYRKPARKALESNAEVLHRLSSAHMNPYYGDNIHEALVTFLAMGLNIDENVGKLTGFLEAEKLLENTIVVFFTDNGSSFGRHYYNAGMKGGKQELFEGGHRVPLFMNGPESIIGEKAIIDELCHVQDLLPTLASAVGIESIPGGLDGVDLTPLMRQEKKELEDRMLVVNFTKTPGKVFFPEQDNPDNAAAPKKERGAVLWKNWRYLNDKTLYDLSNDPHQDKDVAAQHPEVVASMKAHLDGWWEEVKEDANKVHRIVIGSPRENPMMLTACDWYNIFVDQQKQVRNGARKSGYWHVIADRPGTYDFELRRWPVESGYKLNDAIPETTVTDGVLPEGVSFPIASASIKVGDKEKSGKVSPNDASIRFTFDLDAGETSILTNFLNGKGERIAGAYYLYVNRRADMTEATSPLKPRANNPVFEKLHRGINMDISSPERGVWPKIQQEAGLFEAAADAGFESVRIFSKGLSSEKEIKNALDQNLAIVLVLWGSGAWAKDQELAEQEIAEYWRELAEAWKDYPEDLVFEVLNEAKGIGFEPTHENHVKVMALYNAAAQAIRDVDPDRPILLSVPGYNDSEYLDPYATEEFLSYQFDGGFGFYDDPNTGMAIHFYNPRPKDGINFAFWTDSLGTDEARWRKTITEQIMYAVNWRDKIGVDIPIITSEWGCWQFEGRGAEILDPWLDHHMDLFERYHIGNMWYTGMQNNQRSFAIYNSEFGWNQTVLNKLTGVTPSKLPPTNQVINGEFFHLGHAWKVNSDSIKMEFISGDNAFSGRSMLKLSVPEGAEAQLYLQTYRGGEAYKGAPGRTLLHLVEGQSYRISFIAASESRKGQLKVALKDAKSGRVLYDSKQEDRKWIKVTDKPQSYTKLYTHSTETEMDVRLEFDFGSKEQVVYLDKVELVRN